MKLCLKLLFIFLLPLVSHAADEGTLTNKLDFINAQDKSPDEKIALFKKELNETYSYYKLLTLTTEEHINNPALAGSLTSEQIDQLKILLKHIEDFNLNSNAQALLEKFEIYINTHGCYNAYVCNTQALLIRFEQIVKFVYQRVGSCLLYLEDLPLLLKFLEEQEQYEELEKSLEENFDINSTSSLPKDVLLRTLVKRALKLL